MRKLIAVTVFDSKAEVYTPPIFIVSAGAAIRSFQDSVNDGKSPHSQHPADYTLFAIGEFSDETGKLVPYEALKNLGNGLTFVQKGDADITSSRRFADAR